MGHREEERGRPRRRQRKPRGLETGRARADLTYRTSVRCAPPLLLPLALGVLAPRVPPCLLFFSFCPLHASVPPRSQPLSATSTALFLPRVAVWWSRAPFSTPCLFPSSLSDHTNRRSIRTQGMAQRKSRRERFAKTRVF
ncbi:unnamed protein product [Ectocarpus sp. 8 AP-2014]